MKRLRTISAALLAGIALCAAAPPLRAETAQVEGFRSAQFDMTEDQVRQAISVDFKIPLAQIQRNVNKVDRTTILSIRAADLLPESGTALINYKIGFKNKKLIQVDVIWSTAIDPKITAPALTAVMTNLRQYLLERGFNKEKTAVNVSNPQQPNIVLMFRAEDEKARVVALIGQFKYDPKAEKGKQLDLEQPQAVVLSYVLDPKNPDIFKIEKGKF